MLRHLTGILCVSMLAPLAAAGPAAGSVGTERADAALDRALDGLVGRPLGPPGAVAVVQRDADVTVHTAGVANLRTRRKIQVTDRMRLASTAKAFSGAVVLSLVTSGRLRLSDTIAAKLPRLPAAWGAVTVGQALHHTSGLPDFSTSPALRRLLQANPRRRFDSRALWQFVARQPLNFAPGSSYRYSNTDNVVAALFAEAATGRSYERLLAERVTRPLGLAGTSLPFGYALPRPFLHGYALAPRTAPEDVSEVLGASAVWASGGIVSTPSDLNRFARGYLGPRLFSRAAQRQQLRWVRGSSDPPGPGVNSAGLAVFRYRTRCGTVYGHTGNFPGYTQFFAATLGGRRSVTVSVSEQLRREVRLLAVWRVLRAAEETAVCAALAR